MTRSRPLFATLVALALLAVAAVPLVSFGADHLDAPGLSSPAGRGDADINDLYVFEGADPANTVLAVTTNPIVGVASPMSFGSDVLYQLNVDTDGDAVADLAYRAVFSPPRPDGVQTARLKLATGPQLSTNLPSGQTVAVGSTGQTLGIAGGGKFFAGLRSDPFFFDLAGFLGTVEGAANGRMLNDGSESDPFSAFNVAAIVVEVPDAALGGGTVGVWATTSVRSGGGWVQVDRMGRPAINTVVNSSGPIVGAPSAAKNVYNAADPANDVADFTNAVIDALQAYSSLDTEGAYSDAQAGLLASVLLPDVVVYDTTTAAAGPLNGRALADDVIDIELRIVTGGDPLGLFGDRDADGAINTDGIGPHTDYLAGFPYLGTPH